MPRHTFKPDLALPPVHVLSPVTVAHPEGGFVVPHNKNDAGAFAVQGTLQCPPQGWLSSTTQKTSPGFHYATVDHTVSRHQTPLLPLQTLSGALQTLPASGCVPLYVQIGFSHASERCNGTLGGAATGSH